MTNTKNTGKKRMSKKRAQQLKRRNLFIAIIAILFTGIVLTATTYAWFTANRTVTVDGIDVNVAAAQGLQISVDAENWKAAITTDEIKNAAWTSSNHIPDGMVPVSTVGAVDTNGKMQMFTGAIKTDSATNNFILTSEPTAESKLVAFDLFFKLDGAETDLSIAGSSVSALSSKGIQNAARVAFVELGNMAMESASSVDSFRNMNAGTASVVRIWEPNSLNHTDFGVTNASKVYGKTTTAPLASSALDYLGVKTTFDESKSVQLASNDSNYFGTPTGLFYDDFTNFKLKNGVTKVRIYMWVEGQDVDCENNASGDDLQFNLKFSIPEEIGA